MVIGPVRPKTWAEMFENYKKIVVKSFEGPHLCDTQGCDMFIGCWIVGNAVTIGAQTGMCMREGECEDDSSDSIWEKKTTYDALAWIFCIVWSSEFVIKYYTHGMK